MTDFAEPSEYADLRAAIREITLTPRPRRVRRARPDIHADVRPVERPGQGRIHRHQRARRVRRRRRRDGRTRDGRRGIRGGRAARCSRCWCPARSAWRSCAGTASAEQQQEWLTRLADGGTKVVFAITEPDAGSNSHQHHHHRPAGRRRLPDQRAEVLHLRRRRGRRDHHRRPGPAPTRSPARRELSLFLVPVDAPGLSWNRLEVAAQIPDRQFTVFYDDVRVPATALIGEAGKGWAPLFDGLNPERITAAAIGVGIGRYAVETAADYARTRNVWGQPIGAHQGGFPPAGQGQDPGRTGRADDGQGRLAVRPGTAGR